MALQLRDLPTHQLLCATGKMLLRVTHTLNLNFSQCLLSKTNTIQLHSSKNTPQFNRLYQTSAVKNCKLHVNSEINYKRKLCTTDLCLGMPTALVHERSYPFVGTRRSTQVTQPTDMPPDPIQTKKQRIDHTVQRIYIMFIRTYAKQWYSMWQYPF